MNDLKQVKKIRSQVENTSLITKRHEQIVNAAAQFFCEKGYHSTSMREIAAAAGMNMSSIYQYISTKDDILYLFYKKLHSQWRYMFKSLMTEDKLDPINQLKTFIRDFVKLFHLMRHEAITMYTEFRHLSKDSLYDVLADEAYTVDCMKSLIDRGVSQGYFVVDDSRMAANIIVYLLAMEPLRGWNLREHYQLEEVTDKLIEFILKGLGVRP